MKNKRPIAIIGGFIIIILISYSFYLKNKAQTLKEKLEEVKRYEELDTSFEEVLLDNAYELQKLSWIHSISGVNTKIITKNKENDESQLANHLNDFTLLFSYNSNMCGPCVNREIENIKILNEKFKNINLIILTQGIPSNYLYNDAKFQGIESNIFTVQKSPFLAEPLIDSPLFAFFRNQKPLFIFYPDKNHNKTFQHLQETLTLLDSKI